MFQLLGVIFFVIIIVRLIKKYGFFKVWWGGMKFAGFMFLLVVLGLLVTLILRISGH